MGKNFFALPCCIYFIKESPLNNFGFQLYSIGWGNGYVGVSQGHPWYQQEDPVTETYVPGGWTFAQFQFYKRKRYWVLGFDTAHFGMNEFNYSETIVRQITQELWLESMRILK